jgi:hypothetical protein
VQTESQKVMTTYTTRPSVTTTYSTRVWPVSDLWYWLDWNDDIMTDEMDNRIVFNTGEFSPANTVYTIRIIPA